MKKINLSEVFASTKTGRILSALEFGLLWACVIFVTSWVMLWVTDSFDNKPENRAVSDMWITIGITVVGFFVAVIFSMKVLKGSIFLWRLFPPNEKQIAAYKTKLVHELKLKRQQNEEDVARLIKERGAIETEISQLTLMRV